MFCRKYICGFYSLMWCFVFCCSSVVMLLSCGVMKLVLLEFEVILLLVLDIIR